MDELKLLIEMVADLPALTVWVLVGYLAYKLVVVGSIYGVIRLLIEKAHHALTTKRMTEYYLGDITITDNVAAELRTQLRRLTPHNYIHASHVAWLKEQLDKRP